MAIRQSAVALVSGGLDSCTAVAVALEEGYGITDSITIHYGQRHGRELTSAARVSEHYHLRHHVVTVPLGGILRDASALCNPDEPLPRDRALSAMTARVPRTYVPGRNTIMLAIAQSIAEAFNATWIITGFNAVDFSGYPDCRPIFVEAWNHLARYATRMGYQGNRPIQCYAPIIHKSKASVVALASDLNAPVHLTWSCYQGGDLACGRCDSCRIRLDAFKECHLIDPIKYEGFVNA
jgi:7-cyano-7-deazaguanine synthase